MIYRPNLSTGAVDVGRVAGNKSGSYTHSSRAVGGETGGEEEAALLLHKVKTVAAARRMEASSITFPPPFRPLIRWLFPFPFLPPDLCGRVVLEWLEERRRSHLCTDATKHGRATTGGKKVPLSLVSSNVRLGAYQCPRKNLGQGAEFTTNSSSISETAPSGTNRSMQQSPQCWKLFLPEFVQFRTVSSKLLARAPTKNRLVLRGCHKTPASFSAAKVVLLPSLPPTA